MAVSKERKGGPFDFLLLIPLVLVCVYYGGYVLIGTLVTEWPPTFIERAQQRREVMKRAEGAGGWEAVRRDCLALAKAGDFRWNRFGSNSVLLPPAVAALRPKE